jgi:hypothetical protein
MALDIRKQGMAVMPARDTPCTVARDVTDRPAEAALDHLTELIEAAKPHLRTSGPWEPRPAYGQGARPKRVTPERHVWRPDEGGPVLRVLVERVGHPSRGSGWRSRPAVWKYVAVDRDVPDGHVEPITARVGSDLKPFLEAIDEATRSRVRVGAADSDIAALGTLATVCGRAGLVVEVSVSDGCPQMTAFTPDEEDGLSRMAVVRVQQFADSDAGDQPDGPTDGPVDRWFTVGGGRWLLVSALGKVPPPVVAEQLRARMRPVRM